MKAKDADGHYRFPDLVKAMVIAADYRMIGDYFNHPEQIPPFLYRFKPNTAPVNRALAAPPSNSGPAERPWMECPSGSLARTREAAPRRRVVKGDDEMSPEERDEDDKTFIADLCGQTVDDDSSTKDGNWNEEYGRDDES